MMTAKGENIKRLGQFLNETSRAATSIATYWVTCTSVDWGSKTMEAKGATDDMPFYDVSLGLGWQVKKPKAGTLCLIGVVENGSDTFLIDAEELEESALVVNGVTISTDGSKITVRNRSENLKDLMDSLFTAINNMVFTTNMGPTIKLVNAVEFQQLKTKFNNLLK